MNLTSLFENVFIILFCSNLLHGTKAIPRKKQTRIPISIAWAFLYSMNYLHGTKTLNSHEPFIFVRLSIRKLWMEPKSHRCHFDESSCLLNREWQTFYCYKLKYGVHSYVPHIFILTFIVEIGHLRNNWCWFLCSVYFV